MLIGKPSLRALLLFVAAAVSVLTDGQCAPPRGPAASPAGMKDPDGPGQDIAKEATMIRLTITFTCTVQPPDLSAALLLAMLAINDDRQERARKARKKRQDHAAAAAPRPQGKDKGMRPC